MCDYVIRDEHAELLSECWKRRELQRWELDYLKAVEQGLAEGFPLDQCEIEILEQIAEWRMQRPWNM